VGRSTGVAGALRLVLAVLLGGLLAGVAGAALTLVLHLTQSAAFGYSNLPFAEGVQQASQLRRILGPVLGGLVAGALWWWLRARGPVPAVHETLAEDVPGTLGLWRPLLDAVVQIVAVGAGASVGREGAPRQAAAALSEAIAVRLALPSEWRRLLVAAAAGAGLAAVYNVPISGVVFTMIILLRRFSWRSLALAVPMSAIATVIAWPVVGDRPTYVFTPAPPSAATVWLSLGAAALGLPVGLGFRWLMQRAVSRGTRPGWRLPVGLAAAGLAIGCLSWWFPELPGNGKGILEGAFSPTGTLAMSLALVALKPLMTALYLRTGATGGLLTPSLATGGAVGAALALAAQAAGVPAVDVQVVALVGAAAVLAVTQRSALFAAVLAWELTWAPWWVLLILLVGCFAVRAVEVAVVRRAPGEGFPR
jgi:chloride channel protein, CIC family